MSSGINRPSYEVANVQMTRVEQQSPLMAWGQRLSKRLGIKTAKIAVAPRPKSKPRKMPAFGTPLRGFSIYVLNRV